jgi:hypothetical protein
LSHKKEKPKLEFFERHDHSEKGYPLSSDELISKILVWHFYIDFLLYNYNKFKEQNQSMDFSKFKDINHQSEILFTFKNYAFKKLNHSHKADVI